MNNQNIQLLLERNTTLEKELAIKSRELEIEAALEKVRARTMAMQQSSELSETAYILFQQFKQLGEDPIQITIGIFNEKERTIDFSITGGDGSGSRVDKTFTATWDEPTLIQKFQRAWKENKKSTTIDLSGNELAGWIKYRNELSGESGSYPQTDHSEYRYAAAAFFSKGLLSLSKTQPLSQEMVGILERFAGVFDLTYTRFLDLQKAEAQAREAQIEAGLERVRSRAMAMQSSEELAALIGTVFTELTKLDLALTRCVIWIFDAETNGATWWMANSEDPQNPINCNLPYNEYEPYLVFLEQWKKRAIKFQYQLSGTIKKDWDNYLFSETGLSRLPDFVIEGMKAPERVFLTASFNNFGAMNAATLEPLSDEHVNVLLRFAKVFDLTYTRFNDLQQAEAQAREGQIQLALERIRATTMAMQKSDELLQTSQVLFEQFRQLGQHADQLTIGIMNEVDGVVEVNATLHGQQLPTVFHHPISEPYVMNKIFNAWKAGERALMLELSADDLEAYNHFRNKLMGKEVFATHVAADQKRVIYASYFSKGMVAFGDIEQPSSETRDILDRFAQVFEQTYTRFLDLQKAEAQAREAKIEAALERVRSRTMAMQRSDELTDVAGLLFKQVTDMGIKPWTAGFNVWSEDNNSYIDYITSPNGGFIEPYTVHTERAQALKEISDSRKSGVEFDVLYVEGEKIKQLYRALTNLGEKQFEIMLQDGVHFPSHQYEHFVFGSKVSLMFITYEPVPEAHDIFKRLGKVFEQTYTRFLDLKKAEAQAREAQIEAALERVRGKAMAMHNSNDLTATASLVFTELRKLGISPMRCGIGILNKENRKALLYSAIASEGGDSLSKVGSVMLDVNPVLRSIYDSWVSGKDIFPVLKQDMLKDYYKHLKLGFDVPDNHADYEHHGYFLAFSEGVFYGWGEKSFGDDEIKILKRFASVVDLTFRRYFELQKSEANAKEAVKQAALDRIRADIASMRTVNDLERITPLIWNELTILGVPFIRCGVFIMDEEQQLIHTFLSTPDGKAIAAFHIPYDTPGNIREVLIHWKNKEKYLDHWNETEFNQFGEILVKQGALDSAANYLKTVPHGGFYLHFLPFLQGMLYVGNTDQLNDEEINLIQIVADAFSTAYARYEDFNKLEAAKQQVDKTLVELKQAQTQLVQSEKMASLGELTAGIAHEIQNPLNFVNNFSEVNTELIEELKEELATGNTQKAISIAGNIKENEEKINYHGKRADAIVKGMLQHSRASSGKKESTDINALADEYLRLSYHGLRAKDKSFNAAMQTDFDENIGMINVMPQDIGRVLLNLFTNAFYSVAEKKRQQSEGYQPTVSVTTKKMVDKIQISVKDNGNGIPQKVLEKIYQPFFTTKPTGEGTGLGLSLSYDIITKGHGGSLDVNTEEGQFAEFIVSLPIS